MVYLAFFSNLIYFPSVIGSNIIFSRVYYFIKKNSTVIIINGFKIGIIGLICYSGYVIMFKQQDDINLYSIITCILTFVFKQNKNSSYTNNSNSLVVFLSFKLLISNLPDSNTGNLIHLTILQY